MQYDVFGIGNALVDAEYQVDDTFLHDQGIAKGHMTLVSEDEIGALEQALDGQTCRRMSGGSAANTVYSVRGFGGSGYYCGRVSDDDIGRAFLNDLHGVGIGTPRRKADGGNSGRCLTLITPEAERTMTTYLGVSETLSPADVEEDAVRRSRCLYVEGYLASGASQCAAAVLAREMAEDAGLQTSLSLSDPSMVKGFRNALEVMLGNGVTQLFCNEEEALSWAGTDRLDIATNELADIGEFVNVTLGARGSMAISTAGRKFVEGFPAAAVDTTGAGDIYAGAVLHARGEGATAEDAARFANFTAAELVSQHGARLPDVDAYAALRRRYTG